ncbi:hypothetical protein [Pelagibacterium luteolum]|uniref:Uncharacterized protein n=1 Tax=Pelagibacterium luteolum TaxID=440168 RepID=A0A1G7XV86_9HYPH|nr:hypothetical protein [Pelagibacterium luteolum]SDG88061.1 hypothetical protein SAMN04487974_11118 [Pelagibacterium luteolum]
MTIGVRSVPNNSWIENKAAELGLEIEWTARARGQDRVRPAPLAITALIEEITPLLDIVHAGHTVIENGFAEDKGHLSPAAQEAREAIQEIVEEAQWWTTEGIADAHDWLAYIDFAGVPVTANSTDAELRALVDPLTQRALDEDDVMIEGVYDALFSRREDLLDAEVA